MRLRRAGAMAGLVAAAGFAAAPATAAPVTGCSPGALMVCAAFSASTVYTGGKWHLYLRVWNLYDGTAPHGLSHVITFAGIGVANTWTGSATFVSAKYNGGSVNWVGNNSPNNNVVGAEIDAGAVSNNGATQGLVGCTQTTPPGQYQTCIGSVWGGKELDLDFSLSTITNFTLTNAVYGWHSQAVNGTSCSTWADTNGHSTNTTFTNCTNVVPEPVTVTLLATGLAGMGGVGFIRRRRRGVEDDGRAV